MMQESKQKKTKIGEKVVGTVIRITTGKDEYEYITLEFDDFTNATIRRRDEWD
jgi:hypothetical protein